jgi:hypothetical protein
MYSEHNFDVFTVIIDHEDKTARIWDAEHWSSKTVDYKEFNSLIEKLYTMAQLIAPIKKTEIWADPDMFATGGD